MEANKVLSSGGGSGADRPNRDVSLKWLGRIVETREFHDVLATVVHEVLLGWAGDSRLKRFLALPAADILKKELTRPEGRTRVTQALEDPDVLGFLAEILPDLARQANGLATGITRAYEALSPEEQKGLTADLIRSLDFQSLGKLADSVVKASNRISEEDPEFWARELSPQISNWLAEVDFGELREAGENASRNLPRLVGALMDILFQYPAKLVIAASFLPVLANTLVHGLLEVLSRANLMAPDVVVDVILSFQREVDGKTVGALVNQVAELVRKIHTGSALLGEPGRPAFAPSLAGQMERAIREIDGELLLKARSFFIDGADTFDRVLKDTLRKHNDHLMMHLSLAAAQRNFRHRARLRSLSLLADMSDEALGPAFAQAASTWNSHDLAEGINVFAGLVNRAHRESPEVMDSIITELFSSVDEGEAAEFMDWLYEEYVDEARPLARAIFPPLARAACEWFAPEDDGRQEQVDEALNSLKKLLFPETE